MLAFTAISLYVSAEEKKAKIQAVKYYDHKHFHVEGTAFNYSVKENLYDRLPASYKSKVREAVWNLSKHSAGISVRFFSNTTSVRVRWELLNDMKMNHMAETGIKGIDLYFKNGKSWQYVNTARPDGKFNEFLLVDNMTPEKREFRMYLPLYDGVISLEVGIDTLSFIEKPSGDNGKPVVFYGTSITQGGCASRPGMVHSSIISRKLGVDCINFGFSGNGRMEQPVAELISGIDALLYVIECTENMSSDQIRTNTRPLVETIRLKHPATPVIIVDNLLYEKASLDDTTLLAVKEKNKVLKEVYQHMLDTGFSNLYFIEKEGALGTDHEGTVDGVHFTDLGFMRYSDFLIGKFRQFNMPVRMESK